MASMAGAKPRPEVGQILLVIHDFSARSSDELSLTKGDRVELIERDDDFGDGWYLGRHLTNGNNGLFPEVYTRLAPLAAQSFPNNQVLTSKPYLVNTEVPAAAQPNIQSTPVPQKNPTSQPDSSKQEEGQASTTGILAQDSLLTSPTTQNSEPPPSIMGAIPSASVGAYPKSLSLISAAKSHNTHGQDSPVMNETLSVIDEHITDMKSPSHNGSSIRNGNDSESEYSSTLDQRLSYINGEETDEEEDVPHTQEEVASWNADQVAEYLFTAGVEQKHCEVFRDQEITGDVLMGMDQASVFLREFDLGSVGRRLKTWQKIKVLQDEINGMTRRNTGTYGSEAGSDDLARSRSRSSTAATMLPRIPSLMERPGSHQQTSRFSQSRQNSLSNANPVFPKTGSESSTRPIVESRPSAASIRDLHHSRHSSVAQDFAASSIMGTLAADAEAPISATPTLQDALHKKQPSFDRNWTMGGASPTFIARPMSSGGGNTIPASETLSAAATPDALDALDRGYFSGGEAEGRQRNVLRKKGTTSHSRNSSYADEQRARSVTSQSKHSRFGSVDSIRDSPSPSAAQKYYGLSVNGRRRAPSAASVEIPSRPMPPPKDAPSPIVTNMETGIIPPKSSGSGTRHASDWLLPVKPLSQSRHFGLRAISDAVTGHEKSRANSPGEPLSSFKDSLDSPVRTESSTPSAGPSLDLDSPEAKNTSAMTTPASLASKSSKKKSKKETSAYTRGLLKKSPKEQMVDADYCGWMKKKSTNLMTTWKPRLFILKGRRLSYYYSEDDDQEKGLIDISFHRVLPADNDRLTGLHATLTGATTSPTTPIGAHTQTTAEAAAAAEPESTLGKGVTDQMFIFKLVPPRTGLSRAVTFTKPTVHYFAVPNIKQGRLWMAALMKATIDRDDSAPITTTYQQKTISLAKARQMRHRPPALMNLDEHADEEELKTPASDRQGLNIQGVIYDGESQEGDSGVSGILRAKDSNSDLPPKSESARAKTFSWDGTPVEGEMPLSA